MDDNKLDYSVVIPVYNSEKTLDELYERIKDTFSLITENYEIILVDDCSTDESWGKLKYLHEKDKRVKVIHLLRNFGQNGAIICGLNHCNGNRIVTLDDDLQHPPEEIPKLIGKMNEGYTIVYGKYQIKRHSRFENFLSGIFQIFYHEILDIPKNIYISSFTIYDHRVVKNAISIKSSHPFIPALIRKSTHKNKMGNVEVIHNERKLGRSNYSLLKYFKFSLDLLINYSSVPLFVVGIIGTMISILSIFYGMTIIIRKLMSPDYGIMGWNSLMVAITLLSGTILMSIAIIGEYLRRILEEISYEKQYIIEEKYL